MSLTSAGTIHSGTLLGTVHPLHSHANHGQLGSCSQVLRRDSDTTLLLGIGPAIHVVRRHHLLVAVSMPAYQWWWRVRNEAHSVN